MRTTRRGAGAGRVDRRARLPARADEAALARRVEMQAELDALKAELQRLKSASVPAAATPRSSAAAAALPSSPAPSTPAGR